jgi:Flp pilus assembly protein TadD
MNTLKNRHLIASLFSTVLASATLLLAPNAHAADDPPAAPPANSAKAAPADPLGTARNLIQQDRWRDAITELQRVNLSANADWNNLMGYSHRKAKTPDLAAAQRYYDVALQIDPKHKGALEYSGELYLMKNDLPAAKARLASLETVCGRQCAEFELLRTAIANHEAKPRN